MTVFHPPPATEEPALRALLDRIVPVFRPEAIYLFGSRAERRGGLESDWDLLVVVPDDTPHEHLTVVAGYEAVRGTGPRRCRPDPSITL